MAEIFGIVASGLSVAQIAGSIVTTSLKVKTLLDEVKDAPEILSDMLDNINILTPIVCETITGGDSGTSTIAPASSAAPHLHKALQNALTAGEQLESLAADLKSQIDAARGGARRKRAMFKVVLKRGTLARYEARLQMAIHLLNMAQGAYAIALQRTQPEIIVSQLVSAFAQPPQVPQGPAGNPHEQGPPQSHSPSKSIGRRISSRKHSSALQEYWQVGCAKVTGLVRIHTSSGGGDDQTAASAPYRVLRVQVRMPTWLCAAVLDVVFSQRYAGWDHSLNVFGYLVQGAVEFDLARYAIVDDDVDALHRLFQERRCRPRDRLVWQNMGVEDSLLELALRAGAWQACGYLLDCGAAQPGGIGLQWASGSSENSKQYVEALLRHDESNDEFKMNCLASYCTDLDSFTDQVGRHWPYNEFYTEELAPTRLVLAGALVACTDETWVPPSDIFQHLCKSVLLADAGRITTSRVLSCVTWGLGNIVWRDPDVVTKWYSVIRDIALHLDKSLVMPEQQVPGYELIRFDRFQLFPTSTPLTDMFMGSMFSLPGYNASPKQARQHKIESRLANCARALQIWLSILQECGIDLCEYGRQELQRLKDEDIGWEFRISRDVWYQRPFLQTRNGEFEVRLISLEYGSQPGDWKLWWSEPTDGLVGDFWREIEPEPLRIPGSWDEDF